MLSLGSAQLLTHPLLQTVPTCQALYKNTFTYHTVEDAPPQFEECFKFLGKLMLSFTWHNSSRLPAQHAPQLTAIAGQHRPLVRTDSSWTFRLLFLSCR